MDDDGGMSASQANDQVVVAPVEAHKETDYGWYDGGEGTNSSGFSGLPGGYRNQSGFFPMQATAAPGGDNCIIGPRCGH